MIPDWLSPFLSLLQKQTNIHNSEMNCLIILLHIWPMKFSFIINQPPIEHLLCLHIDSVWCSSSCSQGVYTDAGRRYRVVDRRLTCFLPVRFCSLRIFQDLQRHRRQVNHSAQKRLCYDSRKGYQFRWQSSEQTSEGWGCQGSSFFKNMYLVILSNCKLHPLKSKC